MLQLFRYTLPISHANESDVSQVIFPGRCPYPTEITNANMEVLGCLAGKQTIYTCHEYYFFPDGSATKNISCDPDGLWDTDIIEGCAGKKNKKEYIFLDSYFFNL